MGSRLQRDQESGEIEGEISSVDNTLQKLCWERKERGHADGGTASFLRWRGICTCGFMWAGLGGSGEAEAADPAVRGHWVELRP